MFGFFDGECFLAYSRLTDAADVQSLLDVCTRHRKQKEPLGNMSIVTYRYNDFDLEPTNIREVNVDLSRHYNDDFLPVAETIDRFIEGNCSGLVILHGYQGTGKTTYIRHLIHSARRKMIYMGSDLVDKLSDPSFIPFIQKQKNSVIIVEDCEELLASRNSGGRTNSGLVNILNISDGLLGTVFASSLFAHSTHLSRTSTKPCCAKGVLSPDMSLVRFSQKRSIALLKPNILMCRHKITQ